MLFIYLHISLLSDMLFAIFSLGLLPVFSSYLLSSCHSKIYGFDGVQSINFSFYGI